MSEGPGRTLSGWSEGPPGPNDGPSLAAASAITDAPSSSANAAASSSQMPAEDSATPAPTGFSDEKKAEDASEAATPAVGSHILNLNEEEDTSPKEIMESQEDKFCSAGAELDVAQSPEGSNSGAAGGTFADVPADKNGAMLAATSSGSSVIGRVQSTLGLQSSQAAAAGIPSSGALAVPRERVRTPAWCDRVLYHCESKRLAQLLYDRSELAMSDHKPVMAAFLLNAVAIDASRLAEESEAAQKALDLLANNAQPRCTVGENVLEVGELGYGEVVTRSCSLTCSGEVRNFVLFCCMSSYFSFLVFFRLMLGFHSALLRS